MEESKVIVIPLNEFVQPLRCDTPLHWSGISHGKFEFAGTDPMLAVRHPHAKARN